MRSLATYIPLFVLLIAGGVVGPCAQAQPALVLEPDKAITQYLHDVWTRDGGLPQNRVNVVLQTSDGYLWLGTQEGLVRFDGVDFVVYNPVTSDIEGTTITALYEDRQERLWVGTREGGVSYLEDGRFVTYRQQDGLSSDHVSAVAEDADGHVWVATTLAGLNRVESDTIVSYRASQELPSDAINTLLVDQDNNLWIGTRDTGIVRFGDGHFTHFGDHAGFPGTDVVTVFQDREGTLWFGTRKDGLVRLDNGTFTTLSESDGLPASSILSIEQDAAGSLWIGTARGGLARLKDGIVEVFGSDAGLSGRSVLALEEDGEGSLWIGTEMGGLNRLRNGKFRTYTMREGLAHDAVYSVHQDPGGRTWFGTAGGGVNWLDPSGEMHTLTSKDGLPSDFVISIHSTRDGSVWMGTIDAGLARYRNGHVQTYTVEEGLPGPSIYGLYEDSHSHLWIGTGRDGLARYEDGHFITYTTADGLSSDAVTSITETRDGSLWIGTYDGGLNQLRDGRVVAQYSTEDGLGSNTVLSLYQDDRDVLWIGTRGGLSRFHSGRVETVTAAEGLYNDKVMSILEDDRGRLWMSCNRGLFYVQRSDLDAFFYGKRSEITSVVYGKQDGLRTREFNGGTQPAAWAAADGTLWFPSAEGVVQVDPDHLPINELPPPIDILTLRTGDDVIDDFGDVQLEPGRDKMEIHYAGLSYIAPEEVTYRYQLEGVDRQWVEAGTRRAAFYTNLAPGDYTFRVKARNLDGVWSDREATVSFTILPFFYQTTWFYVLCILGLVGLGLVSYRLRVRHLKVRQRELEVQVRERTRDLREEKEKTEEAKAVIEAQADRLREFDRVKTEFFNNISHEFRTPLTLNIGPLENALNGVYGPLGDTMRRQVEIMLRNSRRLLRLINQLLDLSKLDTDKVGLEVQRRDFVGFLRGVVLSFSAFAEKKRLLLQLDAEVESLWMYFDPNALEKVFFNLLSNAVKFTPEEGRITVELRTDAAGERVEVAVHDTGCGMSDDQLPHIFDRFHQVNDAASRRVQEGTGIGLALVRELVDLHGGTIRVESEVGKGTSFFISLARDVRQDRPDFVEVDHNAASQEAPSHGPMVEMAVLDEAEPVPAPEPAPAAASTNGAAPTPTAEEDKPLLLVVDDNEDIREYVTSCLVDEYRVLTAQNGRDALEQARAQHPELIVSDVTMPVMGGYELCRRVRADETLQHIPIIFLTSRAGIESKIEGLDAGGDDYLTKPFNARELTVRVRNLLTLREHQQALVEANAALRDAVEQKSNLLQVAAHDMRNPVANIQAIANMVREDVEVDPKTDELLDLLESSADNVLQMIGQMLEAEALESDELEVTRKPVDLRELVDDVVDKNRPRARQKQQLIELEADPVARYHTVGDAGWLAEAVDNLVSNAIKYSPLGKPITILLQDDEERVRMAVRDEGPGLSDEDQKRLFMKFQRLTPRPTGGETSTGLGLAIVKQIANLHEGTVGVESAPGEGSLFYIDLPRAEFAVDAACN